MQSTVIAKAVINCCDCVFRYMSLANRKVFEENFGAAEKWSSKNGENDIMLSLMTCKGKSEVVPVRN